MDVGISSLPLARIFTLEGARRRGRKKRERERKVMQGDMYSFKYRVRAYGLEIDSECLSTLCEVSSHAT